MKKSYSTPEMNIDILEKIDVLLASGEESPTEPTSATNKREKENVYKDAISFFFTEDWWA